jgi:hypothetical protein
LKNLASLAPSTIFKLRIEKQIATHYFRLADSSPKFSIFYFVAQNARSAGKMGKIIFQLNVFLGRDILAASWPLQPLEDPGQKTAHASR